MYEKTQEPIIVDQWVVGEGGKLMVVIRPFFLNTKLGPPTPVQKGWLVRVDPKVGEQLFFAAKAEPVELSDTFEVIRSHITVDENGEWLSLEKGDILSLSREEAIPLLRQQKIKERKGGTADAVASIKEFPIE